MPLRKRAFTTLGAVVTCCAVTVACTPDEPAAEPTPTTIAPTPTVSPTESEQAREERLAYEGAETAYRKFHAEYDRITTTSFNPHTNQVLRDNAAGPYLKGYEEFIETRRKAGVRSTAGSSISWIKREGYSRSEVILESCEDGSKARLVKRDGKVVTRGVVGTNLLTVRFIEARWRVWDVEQKDVTSCDE